MSPVDNIESCYLQEVEYYNKMESDAGKIPRFKIVSSINVIINKAGKVRCFHSHTPFRLLREKWPPLLLNSGSELLNYIDICNNIVAPKMLRTKNRI